jgi:hypothetical protein
MAKHLREPLHVRLRLHVGPADVMLTACPVPRVWGATSRAWVADQR